MAITQRPKIGDLDIKKINNKKVVVNEQKGASPTKQQKEKIKNDPRASDNLKELVD